MIEPYPEPYYHLPPYRGARTLATLTIASLLVCISGSVYELIIELEGYALVKDVYERGDVPQSVLEAYDAKALSVLLWSLAATALCATMFCMWIVRASKNVQAMGRPLKMSPGWAAGSFFVPIMNFWRPYIAVSNVWEMSDPDLGPNGPRVGTGLVLTWWILWVGSRFVGMRTGLDRVDSVADIHQQQLQSVVVAVAYILAGVFAIVVVHRLTRLQEDFAERYMVPPAEAVQR